MADHDTTHPSSVKPYILVFVGLGLLTALTVSVSYLGLTPRVAVLCVSLIAAAKVTLIAAFFMHLRFEKRGFLFLLLTALFFVAVLVSSLIQDIGIGR